MHEAACNTIPVKQEPRSHMMVPWWNKECDKAVRNRNKAYRRLGKYPMLVYAMEYKCLRAVARRVIKDAKRNSWKFCGMLGPESPVRHLWSAVCRMSGVNKRRSIPVLQKGEVVAVSNKEKANMCVESFQAVHRSERMGVERYRKRAELLAVNQWKLVPGHAGVRGNEQVDNIAKESLGREVDVHVLLGRVLQDQKE